MDVADVDGLREMADWFRDKVGSGTAVLATVLNGKPLIVATVTDDLIKRGLKAGDLVRDVAKMVGGGGGGRPNMAQAGGRDASKLPEALTAVAGLVEKGFELVDSRWGLEHLIDSALSPNSHLQSLQT